ncbi:hypothetical protein I79_013623 [Cricetulus griseus]|uniref:Uncharacterized protein n=1 Tax=Cricetulus griseus TaxID=10029 RepID=G3HRZ8_CRIGR|nr:hypothetical protein I79_013623 [Cricetulus griseus]
MQLEFIVVSILSPGFVPTSGSRKAFSTTDQEPRVSLDSRKVGPEGSFPGLIT